MLELIGVQEDLVTKTCNRFLEYRAGADLSSTAARFPQQALRVLPAP